MSHPRGVKTTAFGVFAKICWKECTENKTFEIKTLEDFRNQCSVWWYRLSPQEMSRFNEIAENTNSQNIALAKAYTDNVTGLPTFDNQFSDIDHPLNYSDRAENSLNFLMKQSKQITRHVSDNSSGKPSNRKRSSNSDKTIEIKSKANKTDSKVNAKCSKQTDGHINTEPNKPTSKDQSIVQNIMKLQTEPTQTWKNCLAICDRVLKEIRHTNTEPNKPTSKNQPMNTMKLQTEQTQTWKNCLAIGDRILKEISQATNETLAKDGAVVVDKVVTQQRISESNDDKACLKCDESDIYEEQCLIKSETEQSSSLHNYEDIPDRFVRETELVSKKIPGKFIPPIKTSQLPKTSIKTQIKKSNFVKESRDIVNRIMKQIEHDDNERLAQDKDKENLQNCEDISDKFVEG